MSAYISVACALGNHSDDDLPNGSPHGSIPPCSCKCHKPERTWCGIHRCCREANHEGACEEDATMLD